jgi:cytochrome c-type biogenesis protein CcsB
MLASILEIFNSTEFVLKNIYHAWWFILLCFTTFLLFLFHEIKEKIYLKNLHRWLLLCSAAIIIIGSTTSLCTAKHGNIHLRLQETAEKFLCKNGIETLPFSIQLIDFKILTYQGTSSPANYVSYVVIKEKKSEIEMQISVNHPIRYKGYRFFQSSYDSDMQGSVLLVTYDFWGTLLIYLGYVILLAGILVWAGKKIFFLIKSVKNRKTGLLLLFLLLSPSLFLSAQKTIQPEEAKQFGNLAIYYQGRIAPISTYAKDFTLKLTGKIHYGKYSAEQFLTGCLFFPKEWQKEILKLPTNRKEVLEWEEKCYIFSQLQTGESLKIFPQGNRWYTPYEDISFIKNEDSVFIFNILPFLYENISNNDHEQVTQLIHKIALFQQSRAENSTVNFNKLKLESLLNHCPLPTWLFPIILFFASLSFVKLILTEIFKKKIRWLHFILLFQIAAVFIMLTVYIAARSIVAGHIPLSNTYETLLFLSWFIVLLTFFIGRKNSILLFGGELLAGFTLLVCSINASKAQITALMPVLNSPWLNVHVTLIMFSYALLAFTSILAILFLLFKVMRFSQTRIHHLSTITSISQAFLPVAVAMLTLGIISGSVWANLSWGRYWGWDPKEVWAFITALVYGIALCHHEIPLLQKEKNYHLFVLFAFVLVLITYFGVNLWFGGLHSYGN